MMKITYILILLSYSIFALANTPVMSSTNNGKAICSDIRNGILKAHSMSKLVSDWKSYKKQTVQQCLSQLKNDASVKQATKRLAAKQKKNIESQYRSRQNKKIVPIKKLTANQKLQKYNLLGMNKKRVLKSSSQTKRLKSPPVPTGRAENWLEIVPNVLGPGVQAVIEANGHNFGHQQGKVKLLTKGKHFTLDITDWYYNWIGFRLPDSIDDVYQDDNAVIAIELLNGKRLVEYVRFVPLMEEKYVWDAIAVTSVLEFWDFDGASGNHILFDNVTLGDEWVVTDVEYFLKNCRRGNPSVRARTTSLETQVAWAYGWMGNAYCGVDVTVQGPKGTDSQTDSLRQN